MNSSITTEHYSILSAEQPTPSAPTQNRQLLQSRRASLEQDRQLPTLALPSVRSRWPDIAPLGEPTAPDVTTYITAFSRQLHVNVFAPSQRATCKIESKTDEIDIKSSIDQTNIYKTNIDETNIDETNIKNKTDETRSTRATSTRTLTWSLSLPSYLLDSLLLLPTFIPCSALSMSTPHISKAITINTLASAPSSLECLRSNMAALAHSKSLYKPTRALPLPSIPFMPILTVNCNNGSVGTK
jgi:hypothetical protein